MPIGVPRGCRRERRDVDPRRARRDDRPHRARQRRRGENRRVCRDLLEFLDTRKPPATSLEAWDDRITDCVRWSEVPGMGMFDVDGLEDVSDRSKVYDDAVAVLAFGTVVCLFFGVGLGRWYIAGLEHERMMAAMLETGAF